LRNFKTSDGKTKVIRVPQWMAEDLRQLVRLIDESDRPKLMLRLVLGAAEFMRGRKRL
jgi:hypothetical protein